MAQWVEDKLLYSDFCKLIELSEEETQENIRLLKFRGAKKLGDKMTRLIKKNQLSNGLILKLKERTIPFSYAGKIIITHEEIRLSEIQIYIDITKKAVAS